MAQCITARAELPFHGSGKSKRRIKSHEKCFSESNMLFVRPDGCGLYLVVCSGTAKPDFERG
jgi:hypothetical protein